MWAMVLLRLVVPGCVAAAPEMEKTAVQVKGTIKRFSRLKSTIIILTKTAVCECFMARIK